MQYFHFKIYRIKILYIKNKNKNCIESICKKISENQMSLSMYHFELRLNNYKRFCDKLFMH